MITYEQKLSHITDVLMGGFSDILEPLGTVVTLRLFWLENRRLSKIRGTAEELMKMLDVSRYEGLTEAKFISLLKTLKVCGLINATKSDDGIIVVSTNMINKPTTEQRIAVLESLMAKELIDPATYGQIKESILSKNEKQKEEESKPPVDKVKLEDVDFSKPAKVRKVDPDSAPELVKFYYRLMHEVFGGHYESTNIPAEGRLLKNEMKKHGDTAEDTRKYFAFILNAAKEKDAFDKVCSLGLYPKLRPVAYQKLVVEKNVKYDRFTKYESSPDTNEDIMSSIRSIYDFCVKNGTTDRAQIRAELESAFTTEQVDEFFKGLPNE